MAFPYYVNPEQMTQDKAEFARKGIARGKSIVTLEYDVGILLLAENPFKLSKIGEIYDRIAFAGVGKYSEFDRLRKMGVQYADVEGFRFSREDVRGKALANLFSQVIGDEFNRSMKPLEVEILVTAVGFQRDGDRMFHIRYDGSVTDEDGFAVLGGEADSIRERLATSYSDDFDAAGALSAAVAALAGDERSLGPDELEVGILDRRETGRCFRRLENGEIVQLLQSDSDG